jgi:hypothetical protein
LGRAGEPRGREKSLSFHTESLPVPTQKRRMAITPRLGGRWQQHSVCIAIVAIRRFHFGTDPRA